MPHNVAIVAPMLVRVVRVTMNVVLVALAVAVIDTASGLSSSVRRWIIQQHHEVKRALAVRSLG